MVSPLFQIIIPPFHPGPMIYWLARSNKGARNRALNIVYVSASFRSCMATSCGLVLLKATTTQSQIHPLCLWLLGYLSCYLTALPWPCGCFYLSIIQTWWCYWRNLMGHAVVEEPCGTPWKVLEWPRRSWNIHGTLWKVLECSWNPVEGLGMFWNTMVWLLFPFLAIWLHMIIYDYLWLMHVF
jgi:hypothetical protein